MDDTDALGFQENPEIEETILASTEQSNQSEQSEQPQQEQQSKQDKQDANEGSSAAKRPLFRQNTFGPLTSEQHADQEVKLVINDEARTLDLLIQATRESNELFVTTIMQQEMGKRVLNRRDDEGLTPLHYAARSTDVKMVKLLLSHGADPLAPGEEDITPLHIAAKQCNAGILRELLQDLKKRDLKIEDAYQSTPLHYAVMRKNEEKCAELLISKGAVVDAKDAQHLTPLHVASTYGLFKVGLMLCVCACAYVCVACASMSACGCVCVRAYV